MVSINKAVAADISTIQKIAYETWPATYSEILSAQQIEFMLKLFYDKTALLNQIQQGDQFILAVEDDAAVGFASYAVKEDNVNVYKLHKLYVLPNLQGKNIGKILLAYIFNDIQTKHAKALELNVNRNNKAVHFYQKKGFEIIKEEDIDIGNGFFMNDYVMRFILPHNQS